MVALGLLVCGLSILYLASDVRNEIDDLATSNSDNTQWTLAQSEVELLTLLAAAVQADPQDNTQLGEVRRRFDIFYSRMQTLAQGEQFAELRAVDGLEADLAEVRIFLDEGAAIVDAAPEEFAARLPELAAAAQALRPAVRDISLRGVDVFARLSDLQRRSVAETLVRIGALTLALVVALVFLIFALLRLVRIVRRRAMTQAMTSARLEAIVSTSQDAILVIDSEGHVIEFNGAAERTFGYSRAEAMGAIMSDLIVPDHLRDAHLAGMARYKASGERKVIGAGLVQLEALHKDGHTFPVEFSISTARSEDGEIFVSYLRDISDRVAAEAELVQARDKALAGEKAKADLLAVMSHEMRTPLNGMLGTLELLGSTGLTEKQRDYTEIMEASGNLLLHHVNDVLDISRLDSGKMAIKRAPFDLDALLTEITESQRSVAEAHGNKLSYADQGIGLGQVRGDPTRLRQILLNLVGNAVKFTRNGEISVEAERLGEGNTIEFRVTDTGIGISDEDAARIFEDFVTLDATYVRQTGGTGLGLGIARRLVEAMGGKIGVESELGEGSMFWVRVPLEPAIGVSSEDISTGTAAPAATRRNVSPRDVLVVEDNRINRIVVREMLEQEGHKVTEAHDGREGTAQAGLKRFDLILMDISMPEMDGVTATRTIREGGGPNSATPIVALTAHALPADIARFTEAGMNDVLIKPITRGGLSASIASATRDSVPETAETTAQPGEEPVMDAELMAALRSDLGSAKVDQLLRDFISDTEQGLERARSAAAEDPTGEAYAAEIHRLAGSASVLGMVRLRAALRGLETAIRAGDDAGCRRYEGALASAWVETRERIEASELTV